MKVLVLILALITGLATFALGPERGDPAHQIIVIIVILVVIVIIVTVVIVAIIVIIR